MSGPNPFRRDNRSTRVETANPGLINDRPTTTDKGVPSLTVEVPALTPFTPTTKRVRIASPPVPVSPETPASYASSAEEARYTNLPGSGPLLDARSLRYTPQGFASNPFQASPSDGERDDVDEEVLENTRKNSILGAGTEDVRGNAMPDAVKATLARFAEWPRRAAVPPAPGSVEGVGLSSGHPPRPTLDVDAFKRLLLTGESGMPAFTQALAQPAVTSDSSSVNTDTASASQYSVLESPAPVTTDTPRTSHEWFGEEAVGEQEILIPLDIKNQKPPVPKPRHGIPLSDNSNALLLPTTSKMTQARRGAAVHTPEYLRTISPSHLNKPLPPAPPDSSSSSAADPSVPTVLQAPSVMRRPPTPPLARRRSQHRSQSVRESSSVSSKSPPVTNLAVVSLIDPESPTVASKAPALPSTRRQKRAGDLGSQSSQSTVQEHDHFYVSAPQPALSTSSSMSNLSHPKPQPPPSRNPSAAKRRSQVSAGSPTTAPPLPPPRRGYVSSRNSFENHVGVPPRARSNSRGIRRSSMDSSRDSFGQSTSNDVLAHLAALQMEVDALRDEQGH